MAQTYLDELKDMIYFWETWNTTGFGFSRWILIANNTKKMILNDWDKK